MNPFFESREAPDKTAIIVGERTMSYRALDLASRALAAEEFTESAWYSTGYHRRFRGANDK